MNTGQEVVPEDKRKYLKKRDIAKRYAISIRSVTALCKKRVLPKIKIGGIVRFDVEACDAAIRKFEQGAAAVQHD